LASDQSDLLVPASAAYDGPLMSVLLRVGASMDDVHKQASLPQPH